MSWGDDVRDYTGDLPSLDGADLAQRLQERLAELAPAQLRQVLDFAESLTTARRVRA